MSSHRWASAFVAVAGALALGACSGSDSGATPAGTPDGSAGSGGSGGSAGSGGSGGQDGGLDAAPDGAGDAAGDGGCSIPASPSGYQCDPWGPHLYMGEGAKRNGTKLRLDLRHDPDQYEGDPTSTIIPPEHQFYQLLTIEIDLTQAVKAFLCTVFTPSASTPAVDASSATFLTDVDHHAEHSLLATLPNDFVAHPSNLVDVCQSSMLAPVVAPKFAATRPAVPDVALAVAVSVNAQALAPGAVFSGWLARGYLLVDEESELSPQVSATVIAVQ